MMVSSNKTNMLFGQMFFVFGIGTTVIGGAKAPEAGATWPDTLPVFLVGAVLAIVGIVLWRKATSALKQEAGEAGENEHDALALLNGLQEPLAELRKASGNLDSATLLSRVDSLLDGYVLPMGETRQQFIDRFGMEKGAEILVTLAFGERMLNRVWSAAADGHLPEALSSLEESGDAFIEAAGLAA